MRDVILNFINELRQSGLCISLSESMDAMQALAAIGLERDFLREALAASLVKEEEDRPTFDEIFARFFAGPGRKRKGKLEKQTGEGEGQRAKETGMQSRPQEQPAKKPQTVEQSSQSQKEQQKRQEQPGTVQETKKRNEKTGRDAKEDELQAQQETKLALRRALLEKPFKEFDARDVESTKELVAELARRLRGRLSRRYKRGRRGRFDFRRTFRASVARGGAPIELFWRYRRPGKPDLVALCDLSGSVAIVSDFLLALIAPAADYFRRAHTFAYVDRLCEVSFENGYVVPHETLDLYARSDFGKVLQQFWGESGEQLLTRNTIVLVLGDARNNRRPPRPDLLARMHDRVKKLIWLNPEPRERWNIGDSVMSAYTQSCDLVLGCGNLKELLNALTRLL
ncbi:MAG: VWA domain-containing protein [Candidatus Binatia bacterium]